MNPTTANSQNVAHLEEISSNQEVEKMEELEAGLEMLGGEVRDKIGCGWVRTWSCADSNEKTTRG